MIFINTFDNKGHTLSPPLLFVPFYSALRNLYGIYYFGKWMNCAPPSVGKDGIEEGRGQSKYRHPLKINSRM